MSSLLAGDKYAVEVEIMDVNIYSGELNCDDVRRKFAGKEIGVLGESRNSTCWSLLRFRRFTCFLFVVDVVIFCCGCSEFFIFFYGPSEFFFYCGSSEFCLYLVDPQNFVPILLWTFKILFIFCLGFSEFCLYFVVDIQNFVCILLWINFIRT